MKPTPTEINECTDEKVLSPAEIRNEMGEAYMRCSDCGARLWIFDGNKDAERPCPYGNRC